MFEKRNELGDTYRDFNELESNVVRYHETNTVIALGLIIFSCLGYLVLTNTFLYEFMSIYVSLS